MSNAVKKFSSSQFECST